MWIINFNPFFVLNFDVDLVYYLTNLLVFGIGILCYYIILRLSIIFCLFSGNIHLSLSYSLSSLIFSVSFVTVSKLFLRKAIQTFLIIWAILLPIKSLVASAGFWIALFEAVASVYVADYLTWSRNFLLYSLLKLLLMFFANSFPIFSNRQKSLTFLQIFHV